MSSCPDDDKVPAFVTAHVLTHPLCFFGELFLLLFTFKHVLKLWQKGRIYRGSMICVLGYFSASLVYQIDGILNWILTPALNLSRRLGPVYCQTRAFFGWVSPAVTYMFLVLFWVERLRQTFKCSIFEVSDKTIARIKGFWYTMFLIAVTLGTCVAVEMRCSAPSKVMDYNLFSMKSPHYCAITKRGVLVQTLYLISGAVMVLLMQVTLGYMYVSRLKALFIDSGKALFGPTHDTLDSGGFPLTEMKTEMKTEKFHKELAMANVNSASDTEFGRMELDTPISLFASTPVGSSAIGSQPLESKAVITKKLKPKPKLRTKMTQKELDYFRKSAIIALTSCATTFVAAIMAAAGVFFMMYWDMLLNALLIAASFKFGSGIYDRLFCCCQRVCVVTVDRATSMSAAIKNSPAMGPPK